MLRGNALRAKWLKGNGLRPRWMWRRTDWEAPPFEFLPQLRCNGNRRKALYSRPQERFRGSSKLYRFLAVVSCSMLPPVGKRVTGFSVASLPAARLSATHNNLCVASLLQIVFAAVTPVPLPPLEMTGEWVVLSIRNTVFMLETLSFDACPLGEGGSPKGGDGSTSKRRNLRKRGNS